jgi:hypothetical protein
MSKEVKKRSRNPKQDVIAAEAIERPFHIAKGKLDKSKVSNKDRQSFTEADSACS